MLFICHFDGIVLVDNLNILIISCSVSIAHVDTACNINVGFVDKYIKSLFCDLTLY